jgi:phosphotriesterase-related protein
MADIRIMTVAGPIPAEELGRTLPHEHIMCDFIGADKTGPQRWDKESVVATMLPYVKEIVRQGVRSFFDCSPMYIGRDPELLLELSNRTGVAFITNTGQYKEPFLPAETFEIDAEELSAQWIGEWENGIGSTRIRPGFIKTAVEKEPLRPTQRKVTRAAALTSKASGLTIATHTGVAVAAFEILEILNQEGVRPEKWVFVHAQNEEDHAKLVAIARQGAWIELDGIGEKSVEKHMKPLLALLEAGLESRVMLSHDAGWYRVGEENGGEKRPYTFLFDSFVPLMREHGIDDETIERITVTNPAKAFGVEL